ncbi:MAG: hypothetical protein R3C68_10795 [Myxococcota bacterium]
MVIERRELGDGYSDNFEPIYSIDVAKHGSVDALLREYTHTAFGGRRLGEGLKPFMAMALRDQKCFVWWQPSPAP